MEIRELEPLIDEKEIARLTRRSLAAVRKDRYSGRGVPALRLGKSVRYRPSDLISYLEGCRTEKPAAADGSAGDR